MMRKTVKEEIVGFCNFLIELLGDNCIFEDRNTEIYQLLF